MIKVFPENFLSLKIFYGLYFENVPHALKYTFLNGQLGPKQKQKTSQIQNIHTLKEEQLEEGE